MNTEDMLIQVVGLAWGSFFMNMVTIVIVIYLVNMKGRW